MEPTVFHREQAASEEPRAARLINDIVIGEETDVDPEGSYISQLDL
nr:DUF3050 domain-containing protein [Bradyrhizobium lablabi]